MSTTVPTNDLTAQVARLVDMDALDRAAVDAGLTASRALARAEALEAVLRAALDRDDDAPGTTASFGDLVVAKLAERRRNAEARRQRIAASGFRLIAGGAL